LESSHSLLEIDTGSFSVLIVPGEMSWIHCLHVGLYVFASFRNTFKVRHGTGYVWYKFSNRRQSYL